MYLKFKRLMDVVLCLLGLALFWWVFVVIAAAVVIDDRGSVLFKQRRIGKDKKEFNIYKFRTMKTSTPKDVPTHLLENPESYITRVGAFLRRSSLDELPQLFNILKGDMTLVGPRPALYNQYDLIAERDKYGANGVTPGLTGYAQINGRDELPIDVKAKMDGIYVKKMGFWTDLVILIKTVGAVVKSKGVKEGK